MRSAKGGVTALVEAATGARWVEDRTVVSIFARECKQIEDLARESVGVKTRLV